VMCMRRLRLASRVVATPGICRPNDLMCFRSLHVSCQTIKLLVYNFSFVIFLSFGNVTLNNNVALMGNSDSLYELSRGT
jgi:hypothetical protein